MESNYKILFNLLWEYLQAGENETWADNLNQSIWKGKGGTWRRAACFMEGLLLRTHSLLSTASSWDIKGLLEPL